MDDNKHPTDNRSFCAQNNLVAQSFNTWLHMADPHQLDSLRPITEHCDAYLAEFITTFP